MANQTINEMILEGCTEFVQDIVMNGAEFPDGILEMAYLDGELLDIADFMHILATNDIKKFLNIEMAYEIEEIGRNTIKSLIKLVCLSEGYKFDNAMVRRFFRTSQKIMAEMFISPEPEEVDEIPEFEVVETLAEINQNYIKLCSLVGLEPDKESYYLDSEVVEANEKTKEEMLALSPIGGKENVFQGNYMQVNLYMDRMVEMAKESKELK